MNETYTETALTRLQDLAAQEFDFLEFLESFLSGVDVAVTSQSRILVESAGFVTRVARLFAQKDAA